jgi:hypothetical protein
MSSLFPLAPRYRLDDEMPWLEGIDPTRHYWLWINGDQSLTTLIPGLSTPKFEDFKTTVKQFRALQPGERMALGDAVPACQIVCISPNCYAIEMELNGAMVWHLFDQETLDSLLMTGHPDWQCSERDLMLGRRLLARSWAQTVAA